MGRPGVKRQNGFYFPTEYAYSSYSGADIVAALKLPGTVPYVLGTMSQITLSTHRPSYEVLALGCSMSRGFTRGPRVVAGQLEFLAFDNHLMFDLALELKRRDKHQEGILSNTLYGEPIRERLTTINAYDYHEDELPLFDIIINFQNEYGFMSHMIVFGVQIVDSQVGWGTNILTPNIVYSYVATDYRPPTVGLFHATDSNESANVKLTQPK